MRRILFLLVVIFLVQMKLKSQDPHRFDNEIQNFSKIHVPENEETVIFTGSSSIRMWNDLQSDCKGPFVINTGFGGSQMSDLLYFLDEAVLRFLPKKVYIYEGDNDIAEGKSPAQIMETTRLVVKKILDQNKDIQIIFLSAKPSPSRWHFKNAYLQYNFLLKLYCDTHRNLSFIDVWTDMINKDARPDPNLFISDSLHMNRRGYLLWKEIICTDISKD